MSNILNINLNQEKEGQQDIKNPIDRIHPDFEDDEFCKSCVGENIEEYESKMNDFAGMIKGLSEEELEKKIAQLRGALMFTENSLLAQKYTRDNHDDVDNVMRYTAFHKALLADQLSFAEDYLANKEGDSMPNA